jgi:hypothetical protein
VKRERPSEERIASASWQARSRTAADEICLELGLSEATVTVRGHVAPVGAVGRLTGSAAS